MFDASFPELVLIFVIALLVLGPQKLPKVAAEIGKWVGRARRTATQLRRQLEREIELAEFEPPKPSAASAPYQNPAAAPAAAPADAPPPSEPSSTPPTEPPAAPTASSAAGEAAAGHVAPTTVGVADPGALPSGPPDAELRDKTAAS